MGERLSDALDVSLDELAHGDLTVGTADVDLRGRHIFGLVTVGDKGQIVIPVRARRIFHIKPGDQLMMLGDEERGLALLHANFFLGIVEAMRNGEK